MQTTRPLGLWMLLVVTAGLTSDARAGSNIWTDGFPHPTRWKSYKVTCQAGARRCSHLAPPMIHSEGGLRYRTTARVVPLPFAYGLEVQVAVTVMDNKRHGIISRLSL